MLIFNVLFTYCRWYLGSALRGGKLKIQVQQESSKSKTVSVTNGISSPAEMRPETMKEVHGKNIPKRKKVSTLIHVEF